MDKEARGARLLVFFNRLTNKDKDLVLKILEQIQKEKKGIGRDSSEKKGFIIKTSKHIV